MKVLIVLTAVFTLSAANKWSTSKYGLVVRSHNRDEQFLKVCQGAGLVIKDDVRNTIQSVNAQLEKLEEAVDNTDDITLMKIINEATKLISTKMAALMGVTYAAIANVAHGPFVNDQKECLDEIMAELETFSRDLTAVENVTEEAAGQLELNSGDQKLKSYFTKMTQLSESVGVFINNASTYPDLVKKCKNEDSMNNTDLALQALDSLKPQLVNADTDVKRNAVEATTGIFVRGLAIRAICDAAKNYDRSDDVQQNVLRVTSVEAQSLVKQLNSLAKQILGSYSPGFFRMLLGL